MGFCEFWKPSLPVQAFLHAWSWGLKGSTQERGGVGSGSSITLAFFVSLGRVGPGASETQRGRS